MENITTKQQSILILAMIFPFIKKWATIANGLVLELCCGTGRLSIPLKKATIDITGLDLAPSMLDRAKLKAKKENIDISFIQGDMKNFDLGKKFDLIFIPLNSLQNTYSLADVEKVFDCVHKHLNKKGLFILDIFNPNIDLMVTRKNQTVKMTSFKMDNGTKVTVRERMEYDEATQVNRIKWIYCINGKEREEQLNMRCFYPLEMDALLKYNNFAIIHKFGDYDESPFLSTSRKQIFVCNKRNP